MAEQDSQDVLVYISTFGAEGGNSINLYRLDTSSGVLDFVNKSENADGHFFIAIDSENRFLYSVVFGGKDEGAILAYAIDQETGGLALPTCPRVFNESFLAGTEPTEYCQLH